MDLIKQHNEKYKFFSDITGLAMKVYNEYKSGLLESAYEAALKYLLEQRGIKVEQQVLLPIFWKDVQLDQSYRMDLVINGNVIAELKAVSFVNDDHRRQLWNYMRLTHQPYGMIINFGNKERLFSEWYSRNPMSGEIERVHLF